MAVVVEEEGEGGKEEEGRKKTPSLPSPRVG
jgi:hypothetical protein